MTAPRRLRISRRLGGGVPDGAVNVGRPTKWGNPYRVDLGNRELAVVQYRRHLELHPELVELARVELRGRDLACWCPLDAPCHADLLLEIANDTRCRDCAGAGHMLAVPSLVPDTMAEAVAVLRRVAPCERCAGSGTDPTTEGATDGS